MRAGAGGAHRRRDQFPFELPPRMLTADDLAPTDLARKLDTLLPRLDCATQDKLAPAFETILPALTRPGDEGPAFVAYAVRPGRPPLRVGAAFQSDGGFMLEFDILPLNFDGRIVLAEPNADLAGLGGFRA